MKHFSVNAFFLLTPHLLLGLIAYGYYLGGIGYYGGLLTLFFLHPLIDFLLKNTGTNALDPLPIKMQEGAFLLLIPGIFLFIAWAFYCFHQAESFYEILGLTLSTGLTLTGLGYTTAHELIHRPSAKMRGLGTAILAMGNYAHFRIEHVYGHHRHVGTPRDPAFAPKGSNLYSFIPRSFWGSLLSSYGIESKRLAKKTRLRQLLGNRLHHYLTISLLGSLALFILDPRMLAFWWGISWVAMVLLETINYVEHYGLTRRLLSNGQYEAVTPAHSWDSDFTFTNFSLLNLGRHSHHHARAGVPFHGLENCPEAPKHPFGYSGGILLAFAPPLWRRVIHPLL